MKKTENEYGRTTQDFIKVLRKFNQSRRPADVFRDFVTLVACSISNVLTVEFREEREQMYMNIIKKYSQEDAERFAELLIIVTNGLERNPDQDFLGTVFEVELDLGNFRTGQFFTPYSLGRVLAEIQCDEAVSEIEKKGYITVNDCCCGSGCLLIAYANTLSSKKINYQKSALFVAQDLDFMVAMMCYIQLSLLGCAGFVIVSNTLTNPLPDANCYWYTPMYYSDIWHYRRAIEHIKNIS